MRHPEYEQLPDPFELLDEAWDQPSAAMFMTQLRVSADRLLSEAPTSTHLHSIAERGPIDFLAYLMALEESSGRSIDDDLIASARSITADAMSHVDVLVILPLTADDPLEPDDDEHLEMRSAMNNALLDLIGDPEVIGERTTVVEIFGDPDQRRSSLESLVAGWRDDRQ